MVPGPSRSPLRIVLTVAVGLLLSPIIYESALICASRWKGMVGTSSELRTPVLDALTTQVVAAALTVATTGRAVLGKLPMGPAWVIGYAFGVAAVCSGFLRRK